MERSKTEEMRRILADIRERLNQQHSQPGGAVAAAGGGLGLTSSQSLQSRHHRQPSGGVASLAGGLGHGLGGGGVTGVTDSVTFPAGGGGGSGSPFLNPPAASAALVGGGGGGGVGSSISGFGSFHLGPGSPPQGQAGGGGGAGLGPSRFGGSTAGVSYPQSSPQHPDHSYHSPAKVRV